MKLEAYFERDKVAGWINRDMIKRVRICHIGDGKKLFYFVSCELTDESEYDLSPNFNSYEEAHNEFCLLCEGWEEA